YKVLHQRERVARRLANGYKAVIVHDQRDVVPKVAQDALALAEIPGDALIGVIADTLVETHGFLRDHPQAALEAGDRKADRRVDMYGAVDVGTPLHQTAMQRDARAVDAGAFVKVLVDIDL